MNPTASASDEALLWLTALPVQLAEGSPGTRGWPERRLLAAILAEAIDTYCQTIHGPRSERHLHEETEAWLFSNDRSSPFTAASICDLLRIDHDDLQRVLRSWKRPSRRAKGDAINVRRRTRD